MLKNSGQLSFSTSSASTSCVKAVFLPITSPPFGGDKREGAGVENYFFNSLLAAIPVLPRGYSTGLGQATCLFKRAAARSVRIHFFHPRAETGLSAVPPDMLKQSRE